MGESPGEEELAEDSLEVVAWSSLGEWEAAHKEHRVGSNLCR